MRKRIYLLTWIVIAGLCAGCGETESKPVDAVTENISSQTEEEVEAISEDTSENTENEENQSNEWNDRIEIDFTYDYSEDIKKDVEYMVAGSSSLQEELENIEKIIQKYTPVAEAAQAQGEMNTASGWFFVIWDTELNNLWERFSQSADPQTKERVLSEQRNWIAMKEEAVSICLGPREEGGSIYPLLQNTFLENITCNRAYIIAGELAKIRGEAFELPEVSGKTGLFVDNQGTGEIYSFLNIRYGTEDDNRAVISVYNQGELEGSFTGKENGELDFTSDDGSVKGIIKIDGWDGAVFKVTETFGESPFSAGEEVVFPFVF